MAVKITYFVHGTTKDNENSISSGWSDAELSELGIKQSKQLKDQIDVKNFDAVFCSDLKRAVDSTSLTFGTSVEIIKDKRLRECNYGDFNGKPSKIVEPLQEEHIINRFPNGESYEDVKKRIKDFLDFLKENYEGKTWEQAFIEDWRKKKAWKPGWEYILE